MYTDKWIMQGFTKGTRNKISTNEPIFYQYWYDNNQKIGAVIHLEYAEDAHYEFEYHDFQKLLQVLGAEENEDKALSSFFCSKRPYFEFSDLLERNDIKYLRCVFY